MKITVSYQRKEGRANYGSEGASCEVEFDFDDGRNVHLPPEMRAQSLDHEVAEWLGFCRSEVDRQLAPPPAVSSIRIRSLVVREGSVVGCRWA